MVEFYKLESRERPALILSHPVYPKSTNHAAYHDTVGLLFKAGAFLKLCVYKLKIKLVADSV